MARCQATLATRHGDGSRARAFAQFRLACNVYLHAPMSRELRRTREPTTEELKEALGYGGPKFDPMPEMFGFLANGLLVAVILWSLGWSF